MTALPQDLPGQLMLPGGGEEPCTIKVMTAKESRYAVKGRSEPKAQTIEVWLSLEEASKLLGLGPGLLRKACKARELLYYRSSEAEHGWKFLIPYSAFDEWRKRRFTPVQPIL